MNLEMDLYCLEIEIPCGINKQIKAAFGFIKVSMNILEDKNGEHMTEIDILLKELNENSTKVSSLKDDLLNYQNKQNQIKQNIIYNQTETYKNKIIKIKKCNTYGIIKKAIDIDLFNVVEVVINHNRKLVESYSNIGINDFTIVERAEFDTYISNKVLEILSL